MVNLCPYDNRQFILECLRLARVTKRPKYFSFLLLPFLQMGWFKSTVCDKKSSIFTLSSTCTSSSIFHNIEVSQSGSNWTQKHGIICNAIFSTCTHGYKAIITQDRWIRNTVSVHGAGDGESWLSGWTYALSVCYHPYLVSLLYADLLSLRLIIFLMLFGLVCNTKWTITPVYILTD